MYIVSKPGKEQVRAYLQQRRLASTQPPSISEIRHQLGWHLIAPHRAAPRWRVAARPYATTGRAITNGVRVAQ